MDNLIIYAVVFGIWLLAQMFGGGNAKEKERQRKLQQERMRRLREQREQQAGGTGGGDPAEDMQAQMRQVFRQLGVEVEEPAQRSSRPAPAPAPVQPVPIKTPEEKEYQSLRSQLQRKDLERKERVSASGTHADALGDGAEEHTDWDRAFQERDLVSLDEAEEELAARMEATEGERPHLDASTPKLDLSKKSLVNALILGEVLNRRGGSWSRNE